MDHTGVALDGMPAPTSAAVGGWRVAAGGARRRFLPAGLSGLAGAACVACCAIPLLLAAGVLGGAGWVAAGRIMPGVALGLVAVAGLA